jgi:hypothetical protein
MTVDTEIIAPLSTSGAETVTSPGFTAKMTSGRGARVYRVYPKRDHIYFILLADGLNANPEMLTVHFGLIGALIGASMKKKAKKKNAVSVERMNQSDPEKLLAEHKHNFKLHSSEIREGSIEPRPFITFDGHQAGYWKMHLRDNRKLKFLFENNEAMTAAVRVLSGHLNGSLSVNVQWDEKKKRFAKKSV